MQTEQDAACRKHADQYRCSQPTREAHASCLVSCQDHGASAVESRCNCGMPTGTVQPHSTRIVPAEKIEGELASNDEDHAKHYCHSPGDRRLAPITVAPQIEEDAEGP